MAEVEKDIANILMDEKRKDSKGNYNVEDYAIAFVFGMNLTQRNRFKQMLQHGIKCGESVALNYGIDYDDLMKEVKRILKIEE